MRYSKVKRTYISCGFSTESPLHTKSLKAVSNALKFAYEAAHLHFAISRREYVLSYAVKLYSNVIYINPSMGHGPYRRVQRIRPLCFDCFLAVIKVSQKSFRESIDIPEILWYNKRKLIFLQNDSVERPIKKCGRVSIC